MRFFSLLPTRSLFLLPAPWSVDFSSPRALPPPVPCSQHFLPCFFQLPPNVLHLTGAVLQFRGLVHCRHDGKHGCVQQTWCRTGSREFYILINSRRRVHTTLGIDCT